MNRIQADAVIIGSGSLSFELIRTLVERLPMMICPRWVATPAQPIAVEDILAYLMAALDWDGSESRVFEIGGPDQVSYGDIMREYARQRGLKRLMISVPVLTPRLSSLWLGLVTPVYARVGRKLIEAVYAAADANGTPRVYWLTQDFNTTSRKLYDRVSELTPFIKYKY